MLQRSEDLLFDAEPADGIRGAVSFPNAAPADQLDRDSLLDLPVAPVSQIYGTHAARRDQSFDAEAADDVALLEELIVRVRLQRFDQICERESLVEDLEALSLGAEHREHLIANLLIRGCFGDELSSRVGGQIERSVEERVDLVPTLGMHHSDSLS